MLMKCPFRESGELSNAIYGGFHVSANDIRPCTSRPESRAETVTLPVDGRLSPPQPIEELVAALNVPDPVTVSAVCRSVSETDTPELVPCQFPLSEPTSDSAAD
jgi:hypothetical protein